MKKLLVRQAVEYGLNKTAVVKAYGGPAVSQVINTVIPPGNVGYVNYNLYPDNNGQGNVAMCEADLKKAGYPNGISLNYEYQNDSSSTRAFTAIQASLKACNINLVSKPEPGSSFFVDIGNAPSNNKAGTWDIAQAIWIPTGTATTAGPSSRPCSRDRTAWSTRSTTAATTTRPSTG